MENASDILNSIDRQSLSRIVCLAYELTHCEIKNWNHHSLVENGLNPATGGIYKFFGEAQYANNTFNWELVLKIVRWVDFAGTPLEIDYMTEETDWNYWRREAEFFKSDIPKDLTGNLVPVKCFDVEEISDHLALIWLEYIKEPLNSSWTVERHLLAGYHLGELNGTYLNRNISQKYSWFSQNYLRQFCETGFRFGAMENCRNAEIWQSSFVKSAFSDGTQKKIIHIFNNRKILFDKLENLPQTLSHLDTWHRNLFSKVISEKELQTVAIDWSIMGMASIGEDLGNNFSGNWGELVIQSMDIVAFEKLALEAYLEGLYQVGWKGNVHDVEFSFLSHSALKGLSWGAAALLGEVTNSNVEATWFGKLSQKYDCEIDEIAKKWGHVMRHFIQMGERALNRI